MILGKRKFENFLQGLSFKKDYPAGFFQTNLFLGLIKVLLNNKQTIFDDMPPCMELLNAAHVK